MKTKDLIKLLKKMPKNSTIKVYDGHPFQVELKFYSDKGFVVEIKQLPAPKD